MKNKKGNETKKNAPDLYMIKTFRYRYTKAFLFLVGISFFEILIINGEHWWALIPSCFVFFLYVRELFLPQSYRITKMGTMVGYDAVITR